MIHSGLERDDVVLGAEGELGDVLHAAVLVNYQDVVFPGVELGKRDAGNPIFNTLSKTTSVSFSACK